MLAAIKRKTLPAMAKAVGKTDAHALRHFLAHAPWSVDAVRLRLSHQALQERPFPRGSDETGDEKKGYSTDDVAHQYMGNVGNGAVSVNAYSMRDTMTFPVRFAMYKPETRRQADDPSITTPARAVKLIEELQRHDVPVAVVLADSVYGERDRFMAALERLHLP